MDCSRPSGAALPSSAVTVTAANWRLDDAEADARLCLDLLLQVLGELLVALRGDDGQRIDLEAAQALALLVDAQAQARPMVWRRSRLGLDVAGDTRSGTRWSCPASRSAECEKMNLSGVSNESSFSFSFMIRL